MQTHTSLGWRAGDEFHNGPGSFMQSLSFQEMKSFHHRHSSGSQYYAGFPLAVCHAGISLTSPNARKLEVPQHFGRILPIELSS